MKHRITIKQVNSALAKKWPKLELELIKGNGYFYVSSDKDNTASKLASLFTTSISVCHLNHATVERWVEMVEYVLNDLERSPSEREVVK